MSKLENTTATEVPADLWSDWAVLPLNGQDPQHVAPGVAGPQQRGVARPALPGPHQLHLPQPEPEHAVVIGDGQMVKVLPISAKSDVKLLID